MADGLAYIAGCDEILHAVRVATGREAFQVRSGAYTGASPALFEGNAFYGTFNNEVLGVNLAARKIGWRYQNRDRQFPFYSSAGFAGGRVVVGGRDKMVHSLDCWTGREFWSFGTQARVDLGRTRDGRVSSAETAPSYCLGDAAGAVQPRRPSRPRPHRSRRGSARRTAAPLFS